MDVCCPPRWMWSKLRWPEILDENLFQILLATTYRPGDAELRDYALALGVGDKCARRNARGRHRIGIEPAEIGRRAVAAGRCKHGFVVTWPPCSLVRRRCLVAEDHSDLEASGRRLPSGPSGRRDDNGHRVRDYRAKNLLHAGTANNDLHVSGNCKAGVKARALRQEKTAGPTPCRVSRRLVLLAAVDGLFQLCAGCKFGYAAGGNFNSGSGLRIASISRLPLRN